jgi:hypothetical protein
MGHMLAVDARSHKTIDTLDGGKLVLETIARMTWNVAS